MGYGAAVKYWEIIIENLRNAGWNCGCISSTDHKGRQFWVVAAEREDAGRFIVRADEIVDGVSGTRIDGSSANWLDTVAQIFVRLCVAKRILNQAEDIRPAKVLHLLQAPQSQQLTWRGNRREEP